MLHDDVIKWKHFPRYWPFERGIHRTPVNSPHKGQWRGVLMFTLICAWINGWVNNREAGDLRRHRAHYDVTVMTREWYYMFPGYHMCKMADDDLLKRSFSVLLSNEILEAGLIWLCLSNIPSMCTSIEILAGKHHSMVCLSKVFIKKSNLGDKRVTAGVVRLQKSNFE